MSTSKPQIPPLTLYSPSNARPPLSSRDYSHPTLFTSSSPDSLRLKSKDTYSPNSIQALRVPSSQLPFRPSPSQPSQPTSLLLKNISQSPQNKPGLPLISNSPKSLFNIPISPTIQGSSQQERGVKSLNLEYFQSGGVVFKPIHTQGQLSERAKTETDAPSQVKITKKGSITSRKDSVKREKWPIKNVNVTNSPPSNYQGPYRSVYKTVSLQSVESKKKRAVLVKQRTQPVINETPSESSDSDGDHDIWGKKDRVLGVRDVSEDWIDGRGSLVQGKAQKEFRTIIKNTKSGEQSPKVIIKKLGSKVTFKTEKV